MSENKDSDFWNTSNDDFWKKQVVSDDWLKNDEKGDNKKDEKDEWNAKAQNPYLSASPIGEPTSQPARKKRNIHMHTIVCVFFLVLAAGSVAIALLASGFVVEREMKRAKNVAYTTEKIEGRFLLNKNNSILLDEEAYTVASKESFQGFPEGLKLIAVFADIDSDEYVTDSYGMKDFYIGYRQNGKETYKKPSNSDMIRPYILAYGFSEEQILSIYGTGNGYDDAGYYFFFVPSEVEEITLYVEKREKEGKISVLKKIYEKTMKVLPEDAGLTQELADREVD